MALNGHGFGGVVFGVTVLVAMPAAGEEPPLVKLGLDVRFDAEVSHTEWSEAKSGEEQTLTERFVLTSGRFNLWGQIDERTTYRIRYEMKGDHTGAGADNITSAINYFYIDHAFSDSVYLRVGKQFVVTSSWEFNYNRSQAYHYSETFLRVPAYYETGVQLGYKFSGQTVGVQVTNSVPEEVEKKGRDFIKGVFWYGNLGNKLFQPIVSYVIFPKAPSEVVGMKDERVSTTVLSAGTKIHVKPFDFDLYGGRVATPEYDSYQLDPTTQAAVQSTSQAETWTTVIAYGRYKMEDPRLHPFIKLSYDMGQVDNKDYYHFTRYSLGAEWFPTSDRYWLHAVYVGHDDRYLEVKDGDQVLQAENTRMVSKYLFGVGSSF